MTTGLSRWSHYGCNPVGLASEANPRPSPALVVVDLLDTLTSSRPYKDAWSVADARSELEPLSERHFAPDPTCRYLALPLTDENSSTEH